MIDRITETEIETTRLYHYSGFSLVAAGHPRHTLTAKEPDINWVEFTASGKVTGKEMRRLEIVVADPGSPAAVMRVRGALRARLQND